MVINVFQLVLHPKNSKRLPRWRREQSQRLAAPCSLCFFCAFFHVFRMPTRSQNFTYSGQKLRDILQFKPKFFYCSSEDFHWTHNIPDEIARTPGPLDCQRRSCCSSLLAWLKRNPHRPALPSMFVTSAQSITNKMDEMHLLIKGSRYIRDCCVSVTSET